MSTWWDKRLSSGNPAPASPSQEAAPRYQNLVPQGSTQPNIRPLVKAEDLCPECGSENYLAATAMTHKRCYDCGYPVVQSGTGVSSAKSTGATKRAVQVKTEGYSPGTIIGKVQ